jgi:hypothetical protein
VFLNKIRIFLATKASLFFFSFLFVSRNQWCTMNVEFKNVSVSSYHTHRQNHTQPCFLLNRVHVLYAHIIHIRIHIIIIFSKLLRCWRSSETHARTCIRAAGRVSIFCYHEKCVCGGGAHQQTRSQTKKYCVVFAQLQQNTVFIFYSMQYVMKNVYVCYLPLIPR